MTSVFYAGTTAETVALGRALAQKLKPGDVVAFYGDLGAGKTTMIKGICEGLGITEVVKSPSFVIITEYEGRAGKEVNHRDTEESPNGEAQTTSSEQSVLPVFHIDLYRIGKSGTVPDSGAERRGLSQDFPNELEGIDLEGHFDAGGVCLIEWAERAEALLPARTIRVRLALEGSGRKIEIARPG